MKLMRSTFSLLRTLGLVALVVLVLIGLLAAMFGFPAVNARHISSDGALRLLARDDTLASPPAPAQAIRSAWERTQAAGSYRFTADAEQTLIPRPIPGMIGQSDQRVRSQISGEITLPDKADLTIRFEGAGLDGLGMEIVQEGMESYVVRNGEKTLVDNPAGLAAPTTDYLGYLAAAKKVQRLSDDGENGEGGSHYSYDIDGQRFAEYVRDQMVEALKGRTPAGLQ